MEITDIKIRLISSPERIRLKAVASVTFEDLLTVDDILVIQAKRRMCLLYPENRAHQPVVVPRVRQFSKEIEAKIFEKYRLEAKQMEKGA